MAMSEQTLLEFDRERWLGEYELRKREIEIKERDQSRSRWSSPVVLAVLAAAIAGFGNAAATWLNGMEQRNLEAVKAEQAKIMEETEAEGARILEVIKTGNADKAAANLKFLVETGLISNPDRLKHIQAFLAQRPARRRTRASCRSIAGRHWAIATDDDDDAPRRGETKAIGKGGPTTPTTPATQPA